MSPSRADPPGTARYMVIVVDISSGGRGHTWSGVFNTLAGAQQALDFFAQAHLVESILIDDSGP